ncbi:hypothetical protein QFC22_000730 [Naganishia vaughanmartiniae]|uniref:Uncharacterized protein n=1 Tax=Naganishia vaughanmartiniae TaxID=1424756 RepID=A0ACC2XIT9_9TREE|nr:hypothetical protein QFC22_000730 [Naganishia vaughanmartiniae]
MTNPSPSDVPVLSQPIVIDEDDTPQDQTMQTSTAQPNGGEMKTSDIQVFGAPQESTYIPPSDLPESYFTPTTNDLTLFQTALSRRSAALTHRPLQIAAQREEEAQKREKLKGERWPRTVIRVRFSDRTVVQREFGSADKIGAVYDFVRSTLAEEYRSKTFTLYQPPNIRFPEHPTVAPATKKSRPLNQFNAKPPAPVKETLLDLQLVPQSLLMVRFDEDELNRSDRKAPLLPHLLQAATPLPAAPDFDNPQTPIPPAKKSEAGGEGEGAGKPEPSKEKKIPKYVS